MLDKFKDCQRITELISMSYEKPLTSAESLELRLHLVWCSHCRDFANNVQMLKKIAKAHNQAIKQD